MSNLLVRRKITRDFDSFQRAVVEKAMTKQHSFVWCVLERHLFTFWGTKNAKFETSPKNKLRATFQFQNHHRFTWWSCKTFFPYFFCETIGQHFCWSKWFEPRKIGLKEKEFVFDRKLSQESNVFYDTLKKGVPPQIQLGRRSAFLVTNIDQTRQKNTFFNTWEPCEDNKIFIDDTSGRRRRHNQKRKSSQSTSVDQKSWLLVSSDPKFKNPHFSSKEMKLPKNCRFKKNFLWGISFLS